MTETYCNWQHIIDASYEIRFDDNLYAAIERVKTSCQSNKIWIPTIESEYTFCPFCGKKVKDSIVIDL